MNGWIIHGFRDSVLVRKMPGCHYDTQKIRETFHSHPSDTKLLQRGDVKKLLQKVLKSAYAVYTCSNCITHKLFCC